MKVVILFALFALCNGDYQGAIPEVLTPSDSYAAPPEAPADSYSPPQDPSDAYGAPVNPPLNSYAPPTKLAVNIAPLQEVLSTTAPELIFNEAVAAPPAQSASFNFLSELTAPPLVALSPSETGLKATPVVHQETVSAPSIQHFQLNIPGLIPPITSIPLPPVFPPVQVLPPTIFPPTQTPFPVPVQPAPVQPAPVPVQSIPVQTVALESNPTPAPVTKIAAQEISVPRIRTAFIPQENYQFILPSSTPYNYAPYFIHTNTLPTSLFASRKILPQLIANSQLASGLLNLQPDTLNAVVETPAVKTAPALVEAPSTSYGTPILDSLNKKK